MTQTNRKAASYAELKAMIDKLESAGTALATLIERSLTMKPPSVSELRTCLKIWNELVKGEQNAD